MSYVLSINRVSPVRVAGHSGDKEPGRGPRCLVHRQPPVFAPGDPAPPERTGGSGPKCGAEPGLGSCAETHACASVWKLGSEWDLAP